MTLYQRITILLVLVVFTTGIFADAIVMTKMLTNMPSSALEHIDVDIHSDMGECRDCLSKSDHSKACDAGCATPMNTLLDAVSLKYFVTVAQFSTAFPQNYTSNIGPPNLFPPRLSNLA